MDTLRDKLIYLPEEPGVYLMYDKNKVVIYVGKSLILKNRIKSYFTGSILDNKTAHLVSNIDDFEYIITNSEQEAFLLEANLIKQYQPLYNIIMKDDKRYPFIKININEPFPNIEMTRDLVKDGSQYYGPFTDSRILRHLLRDLEWIFPHKTCKKNIPPTFNVLQTVVGNSAGGQHKCAPTDRACLNHQLGKCPGPCIGKITVSEYSNLIGKIGKYLLGKDDDLFKELKSEMEECSENLEFEKAARLRDKINYLETIRKKQHVYFNDLQDRDVIAFYKEEKHIAVTILNVLNGKISNKEVFSFKNSADESPEAVLRAFLLQYYSDSLELSNGTIGNAEAQRTNALSLPPFARGGRGGLFSTERISALPTVEHPPLPPLAKGGNYGLSTIKNESFRKAGLPYQILLQITPQDFESLNILFNNKLKIPARGEYKQLMEICKKNAFDHVESMKLRYLKKSTRTIVPIVELKEYLGLKKLPRKMVCIDVSTIQGSETVSSLVFFENGKPLKKQYRHFIIKTVVGQDDFASIAETMDRYIKNLFQADGWDIPDLVIVDGGKGQLNSAFNKFRDWSLEFRRDAFMLSAPFGEEIADMSEIEKIQSIEFISLAKRIEEVFLIGQKDSVILPKASSALKVLVHIRDEAHRFAINHHRKRRTNRLLSSKLDEVKGLGEDKKFLLLKEFGSVENIQKLDKEALMKIKGVGERLAEEIIKNLQFTI